jgi:hypothetical protein
MEISLFNRVVGIVSEDCTFIARRRPEHFFRKYNGFGLSTNIIFRLKELYIKKVIILYEKDDRTIVYRTNLSNFLEHGHRYKNLENDYQMILSLEYFERD